MEIRRYTGGNNGAEKARLLSLKNVEEIAELGPIEEVKLLFVVFLHAICFSSSKTNLGLVSWGAMILLFHISGVYVDVAPCWSLTCCPFLSESAS
jgi:hypothetical protein